MAVTTTSTHHKESDGKSVTVALTSSVLKGRPVYAQGWLGISAGAGDSGDNIALDIAPQEYQFDVPSSLSVSKGTIVRIDITQLTGHYPSDAAYNTSAASATNLSFFKATMDKDANNIVTGILLSTGGII